MIYLIKGNEQIFIERKIQELSSVDDAEIVQLNGSDKEFRIDDMLNYCGSASLFSSRNIVIVKDPQFLIRKYDDSECKKLLSYVKNPLYDTDLIFYTYEDKFSARLSIYKEISKNAQILTLNSLDYKNFPHYAMQEINLAKLRITNDAINKLLDICNCSATVLNLNLNVLKLYPDTVDCDVINKLCTVKENDSVYAFINAYINKELTKCIDLSRRLIKESNDVLGVIALLANQLRFMYQVSYYAGMHLSDQEIANTIKSTDKRVYMTKKSLFNISSTNIMKLLNDLSILEMECKNNYSIDDNLRLEMFILKNLKGKEYAGN